MDREKVIEAMALAAANVRRAAYKLPPLEYLTTVKLDEREALLAEARAALAVAEPAVREMCANEALIHSLALANADERNGCVFAAEAIRTGGTP